MNNQIQLSVGEELVSAVLVNNVYIYCISNMGNFYVRDVRLDFSQPMQNEEQKDSTETPVQDANEN